MIEAANSVIQSFKIITMALFPLFSKKVDEVNATKLQAILEKHIPPTSLQYALSLWHEMTFSFTLSRSRNTCFGNYTYKAGHHKITVNNDLNQYAFLITYIHEIAHQRTFQQYQGKKRKILPHGKEWKASFQKLMLPLLSPQIFPESILQPLIAYMQNPAASSVSYLPLATALKNFDTYQEEGHTLIEISNKEYFEFRGKIYQKLENRRTRVLCLEIESQRRFTILGIVKVIIVHK